MRQAPPPQIARILSARTLIEIFHGVPLVTTTKWSQVQFNQDIIPIVPFNPARVRIELSLNGHTGDLFILNSPDTNNSAGLDFSGISQPLVRDWLTDFEGCTEALWGVANTGVVFLVIRETLLT